MAKRKKPKPGRPPSENPMRNRVSMVLTDDQLAEVKRKAAAAGLKMSEWLRRAILKAK